MEVDEEDDVGVTIGRAEEPTKPKEEDRPADEEEAAYAPARSNRPRLHRWSTCAGAVTRAHASSCGCRYTLLPHVGAVTQIHAELARPQEGCAGDAANVGATTSALEPLPLPNRARCHHPLIRQVVRLEIDVGKFQAHCIACHAMLCCAVLCCAVLCHVVLCYVVLCSRRAARLAPRRSSTARGSSRSSHPTRARMARHLSRTSSSAAAACCRCSRCCCEHASLASQAILVYAPSSYGRPGAARDCLRRRANDRAARGVPIIGRRRSAIRVRDQRETVLPRSPPAPPSSSEPPPRSFLPGTSPERPPGHLSRASSRAPLPGVLPGTSSRAPRRCARASPTGRTSSSGAIHSIAAC